MNNNVPGWNFEIDACVTNQKRPIGPDRELVELRWQNGQVVMHSQTQRKPVLNSLDSRQFQKNDQSTIRASESYGNSSNLIEDETVSWFQYPLEDPLEQEFSSNFLSDLPSCAVEPDKPIRQFEEGKCGKFGTYSALHETASSQTPNIKPSCAQDSRNPVPAPSFHFPDSPQKNIDFGGSQKVVNFSQFLVRPKVASASSNTQLEEIGTGHLLQSEARECSVRTVGSSHCGSNQVPRDPDRSRVSSNAVWTPTLCAGPEPFKHDVQKTIPQSEKGKSDAIEPTLTSSSDGSGSSLAKTCSISTRNHGQKRKKTDAEESEEQSEATELKSAVENRAAQRTGSSRRNRAAEVHNLSERRRRDRINEKMRALQQLIPHSNKTDKASMLDEAIEYLKSLQLQLQVMWMGAGMAPVMFPGIQHYMSQMGMWMAAPLTPFHNLMQLPGASLDQPISVAPTPNQAAMCQTPVLGPFTYQSQMQNQALSEQYARYMGYHLMQSTSQPMNVFGYGSQAVQHSQTMIPPSGSIGSPNGAANMDDTISGTMG